MEGSISDCEENQWLVVWGKRSPKDKTQGVTSWQVKALPVSQWHQSLTAHQHQKGHTVPKKGVNYTMSLNNESNWKECYGQMSAKSKARRQVTSWKKSNSSNVQLDCWRCNWIEEIFHVCNIEKRFCI